MPSRERPGLKNVIALAFVSFFTDVSTEMILGVLPIFVVKELGATKIALGIMEGLAELFNYVFRLFSGLVSDRLGRRKVFVFAGYLLSGVSKPLFAFARTWLDAVVIRSLDRVGKGVRTAPRDALISQSVEERKAGKAFGIHRSLDQMGAVLGPLLAFLIVPALGYRALFMLSFIPAFLALLVLAFFVIDVRTPRKRAGLLEGAGAVLKGDFLLLLVALAVFNLGAFNFSFILVRAGELGIAVASIPLVYMLINITHVCLGYPSGVLADRLGRERVLCLGIALFALTSAMLACLSGNWFYALLIAAVFGAYQGIYDTVSRAVVPQYVPEELRGTAFGVYYIVLGLAFLGGITLVGYLWDVYGRYVAFTYSFAMSILSVLLLQPLCRRRRTDAPT